MLYKIILLAVAGLLVDQRGCSASEASKGHPVAHLTIENDEYVFESSWIQDSKNKYVSEIRAHSGSETDVILKWPPN